MINAQRLARLLEPQGFHFWYDNELTGEIWFSRPSSVNDLFEHISVCAQGSNHRYAYASGLVAVTCGPEVSGRLSVERNYENLHTEQRKYTDMNGVDRLDSFADVKSPKRAKAWEVALADFVDEDLRSLTSEFGPELLRRTEHSRSIANAYWQRLRQINQEPHCGYLETQLRTLLTPQQQVEVDRIAVAIVADLAMLPVYQTAAMTIQLFSVEIEGREDPYLNQQVHENEPLQTLLDLLGDLFLREDVELYSNY